MGIHPIFSMLYLSILRGLSSGRLSIIIPKASTIWLRNSSDPIGFPLKITESFTWLEPSDRVKINDSIFHKNSNYLTFTRVHFYRWAHLPKNKTYIIK